MILPRVKFQVKKDGVWTPKKGKLCVSAMAADAYASNAIRALGYFSPQYYIDDEGAADVTFSCLASAPAAEWYRLTVTEQGALIEYADARGAINGAASLSQLVLDGSAEAVVIEDYPDYPHRGMMIDLARGIREPFQDVKDVVIHMALSKFNILHLHLMDSESLCFASDAMPKVKGSKKRNGRQYTKEQLRELIAFCDIFAIEIIPEIEVPSHATAVVEAYPQFACDVDIENKSLWCICPTSDEVFEMYEALIREVAELFPGRYLHIGSDELEFRGSPELNQLCHWRECKKCNQFRKEKGLADIREEFYYVILRIYEYVKACGKTMIMWNDQIDIAKESPIPKDVLIHFWRVAARTVGPCDDCSMEGFARQGYQFLNSAYQRTYVDHNSYLTEAKLHDWTPVTWPELYEEGRSLALGSEMCAWEFGNREQYSFYDHSIQPSLPMFADRLWCTEPAEYTDEYRDEVYKITFGKKLANNLSPIFGGILPPRTDKFLTPVDLAELDLDYIATCINELSEPSSGIYSKMRIAYINFLHKIALSAYDHRLDNRQETEIQD